MPLVVCPNGTVLRNPAESVLAKCIGMVDRSALDRVHDVAIVRLEQPRQTRETSRRRVACDAGIHDLVAVTFRLQAILEHRDPGLLGGYPIAAAQGVAHHDDGLPGTVRCR